MGKFASGLCLVVFTASTIYTIPASAQTLKVGLTIVPADGATPARQPNKKLKGSFRIIEYVSPGYATPPKPPKRAPHRALR